MTMNTYGDERLKRLIARREQAARERDRAHEARKAIVALVDEEGRDDLSDEEDAKFRGYSEKVAEHDEDLKKLDERISELSEEYEREAAISAGARAIREAQAAEYGGVRRGVPSLMPSRDQVDAFSADLRAGRFSGRFEVRATVALSSVGGMVSSGDPVVPEPRRVVAVVGLPSTGVAMRGLSMAKFGIERTAGPTAEGAIKPEYDAVTQLEIVPQAFARWTDVTVQALDSVSTTSLLAAHARQIAMDEDRYVIGALAAEAGAAVAFDDDVLGNVRTQMAAIEASVGAAPDVLIVNPDDFRLFAGTTPANADDVASHVTRFGPAVVYASHEQVAGSVLVAALRQVGKYVVRGGLNVSSLADLKSNVVTIRSELFSGFGIALAGGVRAIDVVSP